MMLQAVGDDVRVLHPWLRQIRVALVPGPRDPILDGVFAGVAQAFGSVGSEVQSAPDDRTDVIITSALYGEPLPWREALMFSARRRFGLARLPALYTAIAMTPDQYRSALERMRQALLREPPDPEDFRYPGMTIQAPATLIEQGRRGGPILALERVLEAQAKSIRVLLVVGEDRPLAAFHLDLVGAHPRSRGDSPEEFYRDIAMRIITTVSTRDVNQHQVVGEEVSEETWRGLSTPPAMCRAAQQLGNRHFFTPMVVINNLVNVPSVSDVIASQYSEGCFSTWEPQLDALITTVTGSARPVDKGNVNEDELAVVVGVREDGLGALVRRVAGKGNSPPSSEALEMKDMDVELPKVTLPAEWGVSGLVPIVRSKLHGHRGVAGYDSRYVEYTPMDPAFFRYLVSCGTDGQAQGIRAAFSRAECLLNPADPRQVAFTVLPGHGAVIVEKWVSGKEPFQVIWEHMDKGLLQVESGIPQGSVEYVAQADSRMVLTDRPDGFPQV